MPLIFLVIKFAVFGPLTILAWIANPILRCLP